jgi:catechol 2,3-dioxygenase-like lactoylglutathione lyase family enzyme
MKGLLVSGIPKWFGHVNLNVRDLERARRFYAHVLELGPVLHLEPLVDQSGAAFGLDADVRWKGFLLGDDRGARGPVLDVLQWFPPAEARSEAGPVVPVERWGMTAILLTAPSLEPIAERAVAEDVATRTVTFADDGGEPEQALVLRDPDGTQVEVRRGGDLLRLRGVRVNCSSIERSTSYYERVLNMKVTDDHRTTIDGRTVRRRVLRYSGDRDTFCIELCEPDADTLLAKALAPGNAPGLYRMALVTSDFGSSLAHLDSILPEPSRVAQIDVGAGIGTVDAVFFEDPDGTVVEFVEHGFVEVARRNNRSIPQEG